MTKSISCSDAGKDCGWSATAQTEEELMSKVTEHVKEEHKEIELNSESISSIKY
jgi:predicted small metal-binding protein